MIDTAQPLITPAAQVRRAWTVVGIAFAVFVSLAILVVASGIWVYQHATEPEVSTLRVVSGNGALVRSPDDRNWRLVTGETRVREGDRVSTALGTVAWLTLFDGSTVEISENTVLRVVSTRSSRFLHRTKLVVLEPLRGTIYVSMAPRHHYHFSETIVRRQGTSVSMADGDGQAESGTFLVEVREGSDADTHLRVAVLSGAVAITTPTSDQRVVAEQQVQVRTDGSISPVESAVRELIANGDFSDALNGWIDYQKDPTGGQHDRPAASIELVHDTTTTGPSTAVEFLRASDDSGRIEAGIRQRIAQTLRIHSSLILDFEVKISNQAPTGGGAGMDAFPLVIDINYLDDAGGEQLWRHGYYVLADNRFPVPDEVASPIDRDRWQHIIFDLSNLNPAPKQVTSIVVYASGQRYETRVAHVSLSTSEFVVPTGR